MDIETHAAIFQLAIGYTLVGAFIFTVVITCLSLVGLVRFADAGQQQKLFAVLIVELVVIGVAQFSDLITLSPATAVAEVTAPIRTAAEEARTAAAEADARAAEAATVSAELRSALVEATDALETAARIAPSAPAGATETEVRSFGDTAGSLRQTLERIDTQRIENLGRVER